MYNFEPPLLNKVMGVGLVGTGYAAKLRAKAFDQDARTNLLAIAGHTPERTATLAQAHQAQAMNSYQELVARKDVDLVVIATMNLDHGKITRAALENDKHVIVEYPLAVDVQEAEKLIALAQAKNKLLHVEHIELLGGWHLTIKEHLEQLGHLFYARLITTKPERPAPRKWTYHHDYFGFPLIGALSRLHRLIDVFGEVFSVNCHQRYWQTEGDYYQTCLCTAQLCFQSGLLAQVIYGKGETIWESQRKLEIHGEYGGLILDGNTATLFNADDTQVIDMGDRQGLFAKDTKMVLDHIFYGTPLYVTPAASLYTLKVADAARRAAETGLTIFLSQEDKSKINEN